MKYSPDRLFEAVNRRMPTCDYTHVVDSRLRDSLRNFEPHVQMVADLDLRVSFLKGNANLAHAAWLNKHDFAEYVSEVVQHGIIVPEKKPITRRKGSAQAKFFSRDDLMALRAYIWVAKNLELFLKGTTHSEVAAATRAVLGEDPLAKLIRDPLNLEENNNKKTSYFDTQKGNKTHLSKTRKERNNSKNSYFDTQKGNKTHLSKTREIVTTGQVLDLIPVFSKEEVEVLQRVGKGEVVGYSEKLRNLFKKVNPENLGISFVAARASLFIWFADKYHLENLQDVTVTEAELSVAFGLVLKYFRKYEDEGLKNIWQLFRAVERQIHAEPFKFINGEGRKK